MCLRNVFNTECSYGKPLRQNFVTGEFGIALCIPKKDAKEKMKDNVTIRCSTPGHLSVHRQGKKGFVLFLEFVIFAW